MTDIFTKNASQDDILASMAAPDGDIDLITSPRDGMLVVTAQRGGVHVCGRCLKMFVDEPSHKFRPVEWNPPDGQGTRLLLHACCVRSDKQNSRNLLSNLVRGHQAKRLLTRATSFFRKPSGASGGDR